MEKNTPQLVYKVGQVARMLNVSMDCIHKWCRRGMLPHIKMPGKRGAVRISMDDLQAFLQKHRVDQSNN